MSRFLYSPIERMEAYTPGEQPKNADFIKLNTNESPYPPSAGVVKCLGELRAERLRLYPDPTCRELREAIGAEHGVPYTRVCPTNGSDEALSFAFMAYGRGGVAFADITYGFYSVFAELYGCPTRIIPLREDLTLDTAAMAAAKETLFIANPNAPTGMALPLSEIEMIVASNPDRVVVVDEAYVDFGGESAIPLTERYDNLLVCRTYSKSRSMAGARLGYAVAGEALAADMDKLRYSTNPYNIDSVALAIGTAASRDAEYYRENCRRIIETRERLSERLRERGFTVLPSAANFIFVKYSGMDGGELYAQLRERGILVRHFSGERTRDWLRVSIGTAEDMEIFYDTVCEIVDSEA